MGNLNLDVWEKSDLTYTGQKTDRNTIKEIEVNLGYKLPESYKNLLLERNGGALSKCYYLIEDFSYDWEYFEAIFGTDTAKEHSLCGKFGSKFWITEWGYPDYGVYFGLHTSWGHIMLLLDYRKCGKEGEPQVAIVDSESDYNVTILADNFKSFIENLLTTDEIDKKLHSLLDETSKNIAENQDLYRNYQRRWSLRFRLNDYVGAEEDLSKAIEMEPLNPILYERRGFVRQSIEMFEEAIEDYSKVIELNPAGDLYHVYSNLNRIKENIGDIKGALEDLKQMMKPSATGAGAAYAFDYLFYKKALYELQLELFEEAIDDCNHLIKLNPENPLGYIGKAIANCCLFQTPASINEFNKGVEIFHQNLQNHDGYCDFGGILETNYEDIEFYDKRIAYNPFDFVSYYIRGNVKNEIHKDYEGAVDDYSKAININPLFLYAYNKRGLCKVKLNCFEEAIADYTKATTINNNFTYSHYNKSIPKQNLGDDQGAINDCSIAITLSPNFNRPYINRGISKANLGDYNGAIFDYDKAIELNPNDEVAYNNRGNANESLGDYSEAIFDYDKAIDLNPNYVYTYYNRGVSKFNLGDYNGAIFDYDKAIELNPNYVVAYNNRGNAKNNLEDYNGAIFDYDKAIELNPNYVDAYYNRGSVKNDLEDYSGAIKDCSTAIELNPNYINAYYNRGRARYRLKNYEMAIEDYTKALNLDPGNKYAYTGRGLARYFLDDYEMAVDDYAKAIEIDPNYIYAYYNRGILRHYLREYQSAICDFEKTMKIDPDFIQVKEYLQKCKNKD